METEVQRIHDAVKLLGDTALDLATALSSLGSSGPTIAGTGTGLVAPFRRPGDPKPPPEDELPAPHLALFLAEVDRWAEQCCDVPGEDRVVGHRTLWTSYARWLKDTQPKLKLTRGEFWDTLQSSRHRNRLVPRHRVAPVSYISGKPLGSKARRSKRVSAMVGASKAGYDYKHWCQMMRRVRVDNWKMDMRTFALMLDVTESAVRGWEQGVCFSRAATRWRLEQLTERAHSIKADSWKQSA